MGRPVNKKYFGKTAGSVGTEGNNFTVAAKIGALTATEIGYIVRQRSSVKFLVANGVAVQDEDIVIGTKYVIDTLSNTDWAALGVTNAQVGTVFTATVDGTGLLTGGNVRPVAVCTLVDKAPASLSANEMSITGFTTGATPVRLKRLYNRTAHSFDGQRYRWTLVDDSSANYVQLTLISGS